MEQFRGSKFRPDVVVTGEAVALLITPANVFFRVITGLIDAATYIIGIFLTAEIYIWIMLGHDWLSRLFMFTNDAQVVTMILSLMALWMLVVPILVETLSGGRSLGKFIMGTRVVREDGGPVSLRHCVVRGLIGVAELWFTFGAAALVVAMFSRRGKRVGDYLAGTYVVLEPSTITPLPFLLAPELSAWAGVARVATIPDATAMMARRFLLQAAQMDYQSRRKYAISLAEELRGYVYPAPPQGTDPERFIAAVLVLRRDAAYHQDQVSQENLKKKLAAASALKYGV